MVTRASVGDGRRTTKPAASSLRTPAGDLRFLASEVVARLEEYGDLLDGLLQQKSALP